MLHPIAWLSKRLPQDTGIRKCIARNLFLREAFGKQLFPDQRLWPAEGITCFCTKCSESNGKRFVCFSNCKRTEKWRQKQHIWKKDNRRSKNDKNREAAQRVNGGKSEKKHSKKKKIERIRRVKSNQLEKMLQINTENAKNINLDCQQIKNKSSVKGEEKIVTKASPFRIVFQYRARSRGKSKEPRQKQRAGAKAKSRGKSKEPKQKQRAEAKARLGPALWGKREWSTR